MIGLSTEAIGSSQYLIADKFAGREYKLGIASGLNDMYDYDYDYYDYDSF